MPTRERILQAAARLYGQHGYLGATTRRIAELADVSEPTIFRLFGTKDAVIEEAIRVHALDGGATPLPAEPAEPLGELTAWCAAEMSRFRRSKDLLLTCFADGAERPGHTAAAGIALAGAALELSRWVTRLAERSRLGPDADAEAAIAMLCSALFSDALARDEMHGVHPASHEAPERYARTFLRALDADV